MRGGGDSHLIGDLAWAELPLATPLVLETKKHSVRTEVIYLPQSAKAGEMLVAHLHIDLIALHL